MRFPFLQMPSVAKKNRGKLFFFEERARYKFLTETAWGDGGLDYLIVDTVE